jgi:glycosyltransferase involved in cell wall biosynthesis
LKISVIIPTFNRADILAHTLPSVFSQKFPVDEYEVIVVIDGSTDDTRELMGAMKPTCGLQVIEQPHRGASAARNAGLKAAQGELVLFLDDDLVCDQHLLSAHVAAHAQRDLKVVSGPSLISANSSPSLATDCAEQDTRRYMQRMSRQTEPHWPQDAIVFANSSLTRDLALAAGGFDERFFFGLEDVDLGLRLWKLGARFKFNPSGIDHIPILLPFLRDHGGSAAHGG